MAWTSQDQNPTTSPSAAYGQTNYAAQINAAQYNPMGSGTTMAPAGASSVAPASSGISAAIGGNYADRLNAAAPAQAPQNVSTALAKSATPQPAVGTQAAREIQPWGGGGSRFEIAGKAAGNIGDVNGALVDIMQKAAAGSNYNVQLFSGQRNGDSRQHGRGHAVDVALVDPYSGEPLANYQSAETFPQYETFARNAYEIAQRDYPELANNFRWGGYFSGGKGKYGAVDNMHFDVKSGLGMAGGSFEDGLTPGQQRKVNRMGEGHTMWAGLRPGETAAPPQTQFAAAAGSNTLAGGDMPSPRMRPEQTQMAYAPAPEAMQDGPFDAVLAASRDRRPQPPTPQANPRRDRLQAPAPQESGYVVQRGDNLSKIGQRFGVSAQEIAQANGIRDPNMIQPGQRLVMPGAAVTGSRPYRETDSMAGRYGAPMPADARQLAPDYWSRQQANVPNPKMRPSREVAMPTPPTRPDMRIERYPGGAPPAGTVPTPNMRPAASPPTARERSSHYAEFGGPVALTEQDRAANRAATADARVSNMATGIARRPMGGNEYTRLALGRPSSGTPVYGNEAAVNRAAKGDFEGRPAPQSPPAELGMDLSGYIQPPTADERALQGQPMPLPTSGQPMDPAIASQIRQTPVVIVDPRTPPIYVSPTGVRIWAAR